MGKKKGQQHQTQSFSNMVSRAALVQLGPAISEMIRTEISQQAQRMAGQQGQINSMIHDQLEIIFDKLNLSTEQVHELMLIKEDLRDGVSKVEDTATKGDTVRIEISTRAKEQEAYQGSTRLKVANVGAGAMLGEELEGLILGMKTGETKESEFGKDKQMMVSITLNRVSRGAKEEVKQEEAQ